MTNWRPGLSCAAVAVASALAGSAGATTVNEVAAHDRQIQPTTNGIATAGEEALIRVGYGSSSNVDPNDYMFSILRWTLGSVPSGEVAVTPGTVTLHVASEGPTFTGQTIDLYAIAPANAGWNESTPGDYASWDFRNSVDSLTGTAWPAGGEGLGNYAEGLGYGASPLSSLTWSGQSALTFTIPQSILNDWIANPSNNAGILLRQQAESSASGGFLRLHSSEEQAGDVQLPDLAPTLTFTSAVPEPASAPLLLLGAGALHTRRRRDGVGGAVGGI